MIIPWQGGCAHREAALGWVRARWARAGYRVVLGEHTGPWCKARAVAAALPEATGDVLVVADADCWPERLDAALEAVGAGAAWAMPHGPVYRLSAEATADVLAGADPGPQMPLAQRPYEGWPGGGIVVLPRGTYERVPLDPRFVGWSGEDESWARALTILAGPGWRGRGRLWHLWHPPQRRVSRRWGSPAARALAGRYRAARTPQAMRALLDSAHAAV
ncbi:glycosyltransferase family protein [Streptomonospora nanhaiensis]|uniref:hypothetical protein n=1 Tax=Streptomonospora nanhaiensis TaxID=1323731 RepID=UPI001C389DBA|nr:hypothetical protein [Streptomonospora nanhaiensis]MBV2364249.1 hypothetical protein [Streptomonospora nanhaiensis]